MGPACLFGLCAKKYTLHDITWVAFTVRVWRALMPTSRVMRTFLFGVATRFERR